MNSNNLLDTIGEAKDQYILSAVESRKRQPVKRHSFKKPLMLAAIVAMLVMLAGCAAVVVMHLYDMKAGESTFTKKYDEYGKRVEPTEVTVELVTPHALKDSSMQQATLEWNEFTESYDPEHKLMEDTNVHGIPDNYYFTYDCYTWEMVGKLDEIVQKYNLKLLDKYTVAQWYQKDVMYEALGIEGVICSGATAEIEEYAGIFYPNGNFESELSFTMSEESTTWTRSCFTEFYYAKKDTFYPLVSGVVAGDFEQWNYTSADGTELLLVLEADGEGQIFADVGDATIFIAITPDTPGIYPRDESEIPAKEALEQMADLFDYRIKPQTFEITDVKSKLESEEAEFQAQNTYVEPEYRSFGEYLKGQPGLDRLSYCFMDFDGDGREEMLTSYGNNTIFAIVSIRERVAEEYVTGMGWRLCKGGILESYYEESFSSYARYEYFKAADINGRPSYHHEQLQFVVGVEYEDGAWHKFTEPRTPISVPPVCSEKEARDIRNLYPPLDMGWKNAQDFPMDDGTTLVQHIRANDPYITEAGRLQLYQEFAVRCAEKENISYYGFRDVNGDGKTDLLLGQSSNGPVRVATEDRGKVGWLLTWEAYLSEGNTYYRIDNHLGTGEHEFDEYDDYEFYQLGSAKAIPLDYVRHNLSTDTWGINKDGPEISEEEAQAIISKYPPVSLELEPISEIK